MFEVSAKQPNLTMIKHRAMLKSQLSILFLILTLAKPVKAQDEVNPYKKLTKQFIGAVKRNEPYKNYRFFDTTFYGRMTEQNTDRQIQRFTKKHGPIVAIEKTELDTQGCKMATCTSIKVKDGKYLWYHYYDQGSYIQRFEIDTFSKQWFYLPEPGATTNYTKKEIIFQPNGFIQLPGTLFLPNNVKKPPVVIMVHGSGPHDRNGTIGKNKIYLDMALQLVQKGIAVFLYDKRTYVYQFIDPFPMDSMDYNSETVEDAVEAFYHIKKIKEIDSNRVFIAGHSQGAMLGPLIAPQCKGLKGLILLAAPGRNLLTILPEQLDYILTTVPADQKEETEKTHNQVKWMVSNALKPDLNLKSKVMLPFGIKPKYWLFDRNYKVLDEAKKLNMPTILLQGGRDYNVTKKDYDLWVEAMKGKTNFKPYWYENLDHMFVEGTGMSKPSDLLTTCHVSKALGDKVGEFVLGTK
jgi:pimeloyl-ACP methyl ester carboxylesterase